MTAIEQKKAIHFDPRTKILLLVFSMIVATTASDLRYECILILFTSIFGFLNGKFRYSLIGAGIYMALYLFTYHVHCMAQSCLQGLSVWYACWNYSIHNKSE